MSFMINRRRFLQTSAAALALSSLGAYGVELVNQKPRRVGLIGTGWYGKSDLFRLIQVAPVEVVSLCDVDKNMLAEAGKMVAERQTSRKTPRLYGDYRKMLAEKDLDIVLIGTPDHWHALTAIAAMEAGADVYCQKPISVDVMEGEAMLARARKLGRVVQVGTQRRSTPHLIEAKKNIVDAGLLGNISHAEVCCYYHMHSNDNPPLSQVPEFLDYEMWTGPAPLRPYDRIPHRGWWRAFMEYGNGIMGDMCVHMLDAVRWMLDMGWPVRVNSSGGVFIQNAGKSNITDTQVATFDFGKMSVVWQHRAWGTSPDPDYPWGFFIYGDKGTLKGSPHSYDFIPMQGERIHKDYVDERAQYPEDTKERDIEIHAAPATRRHMLDFLAAIDKRGRPVADIEQAHISTASCILANVSMKLGRTLSYDPVKREISGDNEATKLLRRPYRGDWKHPEVA